MRISQGEPCLGDYGVYQQEGEQVITNQLMLGKPLSRKGLGHWQKWLKLKSDKQDVKRQFC